MPRCEARIEPLLLMPPANVLVMPSTPMPVPAEIAPLLLMPPRKAPAPFTRMPKLSLAAEMLPWLLMPPANVGALCTTIPLPPAEITPLLLTAMPAKATALVT